MSNALAIPRILPVKRLSVSSLNLYMRCPLKWRHYYIDGLFEPKSGTMITGSAASAAETTSYQAQIDTDQQLTAEAVLDIYSDEFDLLCEQQEVAWRDEKPGVMKDQGAAALDRYHHVIAPKVQPVSVERRFSLRLEGADWDFTGYLDVETADSAVVDLKMKARHVTAAEAASDLQPTAYLTARRAEGQPASRFEYHVMRRGQRADVAVVGTQRSEAQLDTFLVRLAGVAREIVWRAENDEWSGAVPGSWWCSERFCGFWPTCPYGGRGSSNETSIPLLSVR